MKAAVTRAPGPNLNKGRFVAVGMVICEQRNKSIKKEQSMEHRVQGAGFRVQRESQKAKGESNFFLR
jgi:hypothetical protein